ncbi:hypothetical protein GJAV_G00120300 [Gymnothorax javanicus]|nr:hypothetical protein GJAV_G00120300 [Gymnothorax javanicus]
MLLQALKEKAARDGRDGEEVMSRCSLNVVSYVMSSDGRPCSAGSCLERQEIPSRPQSALSLQEVRSSSRLSTGSASEDLVDAVKHKLNLKDIHEVVAHLRSVLIDDLEAMKSDIQFLQECIEQRHWSHFDDQIQEPTVSELKEERRLIEKELKLEEGMCSPGAASLSPADYAIREGSRSPGRMCGPLSGAAAHSPPPISPKEKPLLARSPRLPGKPTTHSPTRILRTCQLPPQCSDPHKLRSVREDRLPHPANSAGSSGPSSDLSEITAKTKTNSHLETGSHSQEQEKPDFAATRLSRYNPSGSPFPSNIIKPRPPAPSACDDDPLTASPSAVLVPAPPAEQKPATRGQSVNRRLRLPQGGLVSPT